MENVAYGIGKQQECLQNGRHMNEHALPLFGTLMKPAKWQLPGGMVLSNIGIRILIY